MDRSKLRDRADIYTGLGSAVQLNDDKKEENEKLSGASLIAFIHRSVEHSHFCLVDF